jgi:hypothetical protein
MCSVWRMLLDFPVKQRVTMCSVWRMLLDWQVKQRGTMCSVWRILLDLPVKPRDPMCSVWRMLLNLPVKQHGTMCSVWRMWLDLPVKQRGTMCSVWRMLLDSPVKQHGSMCSVWRTLLDLPVNQHGTMCSVWWMLLDLVGLSILFTYIDDARSNTNQTSSWMHQILRKMIQSEQFSIFLVSSDLRKGRFNTIYKGKRLRPKITCWHRVMKCHNAARMVVVTETCFSAHTTFNTLGGKNIFQLVNTGNLYSPCEIQ